MTFTLNEAQVARYRAWARTIDTSNPYDEDCCGGLNFEFVFHRSGIGDTVWAVWLGDRSIRKDLSISDDDGTFLEDWSGYPY